MSLSCSYNSTEPSKPQETMASNGSHAKQLLRKSPASPCHKRYYLKGNITQLVVSIKKAQLKKRTHEGVFMKGRIKSYRTDSWYPKIYHSTCLEKVEGEKKKTLYSLICLQSSAEFFVKKSPFARKKIFGKSGWIQRHGQVGLMVQ